MCLRLALLVAGVAVLQHAGFAFEYWDGHGFRLLPIGIGPAPPPPVATWHHFEHAWAIDQLTPPHDWQVTPGAPPSPGLDVYGRGGELRNGNPKNLPRTGGMVTINPKVDPLPVGMGYSMLSTVTSTDAGATATANSRVNITNSPGNYTAPLVGFHEVFGNGQAPGAPTCYGFSWSQVAVKGAIFQAGIGWKPQIKWSLPASGRGRDPINFRVLDLTTQEVLEGTLFDLEWSFDGLLFEWENDSLIIRAERLDMDMDLNSPYVPAGQRGSLKLTISNGVVTSSIDEGIWDEFLPAVGTAGPFAIPLPNTINFDFDLGNFGGHPIDAEYRFSASGEGIDPVPEPSSWLALVGGIGLFLTRRRR